MKGIVALHGDDLAPAEAAFRSGATLGSDYGVDRLEGICATNLAWTLLRAGRPDEAREAADRAADRLAAKRGRRGGDRPGPRCAAGWRAGAGRRPGDPAGRARGGHRGVSGNADLYTPPEAVLAALVAELAGG